MSAAATTHPLLVTAHREAGHGNLESVTWERVYTVLLLAHQDGFLTVPVGASWRIRTLTFRTWRRWCQRHNLPLIVVRQDFPRVAISLLLDHPWLRLPHHAVPGVCRLVDAAGAPGWARHVSEQAVNVVVLAEDADLFTRTLLARVLESMVILERGPC